MQISKMIEESGITDLIKLVDVPNEEITIATGHLGVCNMDHVLKTKDTVM